MNFVKISKAIGFAALLSGLALASAIAQPQGQSQTPPAPPPRPDVMFFRTGPGPLGAGDAMGFVGFEEGLGGKKVTGAPFTATISTKTTQVLADGNRIDRTTTGTIARDSQGRTRRDMTLPAIGAWETADQAAPHVVFINDVVSGTQYVLDTNRKIAHEVRLVRGGRRIRIQGDPPGTQGAGDVTTTPLGTKTINGVSAQGTRYTRTIPAGQIGNEKPIVITTERWYSPALHLYVLTRTSDPMRGDSVRQLTDIQTGEPAPALFQVPSDYKLKKGGMVTIWTMRRRGLGAVPPPAPPDDAPEVAPPPQN
jgi:hypothetical protein